MYARYTRIMVIVAVAVLLVLPVAGAESSAPKHIFLFIGDGMGFGQVTLTDLALAEVEGSQMRMTRLPVTGQIHTSSANSDVTDSGAAGTALACGIKTNNGMIGQLPDGTPVESVSVKLLNEGMKVGVLTSVTANHATPAPFFSHAENRNMYEEIAMQFIDSGVHFLAGRGLAGGGEASDKAIAAYRENGIAVVTDFSDAADVPTDQRLALLAPSLASAHQTPGDLADATALAIERMKAHPEGFFMMIEGGAIDWVCHANEGWACVDETLAMDRAVEVAYQFYLENPDNTLVIVTADHETGGLEVHEDRLDVPALQQIQAQRGSFADAIPDDADLVTLELVMEAIEEHFGVTESTEEQQRELRRAIRSGNRNNVVRFAVNIAQADAGITWSTGGHTGDDVPVYAIGAGAERFEGTYDITGIPAKIFEAATGRPLIDE